MTKIARNVLNVFAFAIVKKRLFFIINRIYKFHKSYHSTTIRAKMIIRQHDYKKNQNDIDEINLNLLKKKSSTKQKLDEKRKTRDDVLNDESNHYLNDVNKNQMNVNFDIIHVK